MHVVIVGAGIGGLALAQGLLRAGVETTVLERDTDLRETGGYSLHLRAEATAALRALLPASRLAQLDAVSQAGSADPGRAIRDHRGRLVVVDRSAAPTDTLDVDRVTLRLLLADGLGARLRVGVRGLGFTRHDDRTVSVHTDDGDLRCDVLVAADGVGSAVTAQLAGGPTSRPVGLVGVAGRTPPSSLPAATRRLLRPRSTLAVGPGGSGVYVGAYPPGLVWGAILLDWAGTRSLPERVGTDLVAETVAQLRHRSWSGPVLDVVEHADPATVSASRLHAGARYPAGLAPWPAGPVTALGDAVHAMPPTGGQGAGTALRDAHELGRRLTAAAGDAGSVTAAVEGYHRAMRPYAAAAVAESLQPVTWSRTSRKPLGTAVAAAGLPAAAAVSWAVRAGRRGDPATV